MTRYDQHPPAMAQTVGEGVIGAAAPGPGPGPFDSARVLLDEARACAAEFAAAAEAFTRQATCAVVTTKADKSGSGGKAGAGGGAGAGGLHVRVVVREGPPMRLRTLAFGVAYKVRRALDQAAIAGAIELGLSGRSGGFPFAPGEALLEPALRHSCVGYDAGLVAHFRALRPYGGEGGDELLASLGEMAGAMRSQLTVVLGLDVARVAVADFGLRADGDGDGGDGPLVCEPPRWNPRKRELHVATVPHADTRVTSRITERTRLPLSVELLGPAVYQDRPAVELLGRLVDLGCAVVQGIETKSRHLGAARGVRP